MQLNNLIPEVLDFQIIFEKLEEAKSAQDQNFEVSLQASAENSEVINLFKEYEESLEYSICSTFTNA